MTDTNKILEWAVAQIGTKESPANSNNVIYNTHYYGKAVHDTAKSKYPWCMSFVWDAFNQCKASKLFYDGKKTASCTTLMNWAKANKKWYTKGKKGDIVIYEFSPGHRHTGFLESITSNGVPTTIEGNTSSGSDDNGGRVMRRTRAKQYVLGYIRPDYDILNYSVHCQSYGWMNEVNSGEIAGTTGKAKRLEAIKISIPNHNVTYQPHCQTYGWMEKASNGEIAGTTGQQKRMEAIKIDADVPIKYRVHIQKLGWSEWVTNGQIAGTVGKSLRMEAIQIKFA